MQATLLRPKPAARSHCRLPLIMGVYAVISWKLVHAPCPLLQASVHLQRLDRHDMQNAMTTQDQTICGTCLTEAHLRCS